MGGAGGEEKHRVERDQFVLQGGMEEGDNPDCNISDIFQAEIFPASV